MGIRGVSGDGIWVGGTLAGETGVDDVGGVVHAHTWVRATAEGETMIDLHHWLSGAEAPAALAWDALGEHRAWIDVGGRRVAILDRTGQAVHLALHAAQHGTDAGRPLHELALSLERWPAEVWDAAGTLAAGASTGDIQLRVAKTDWSTFNQSDDHSYRVSATLTDFDRVTAYTGGSLAWGTEP